MDTGLASRPLPAALVPAERDMPARLSLATLVVLLLMLAGSGLSALAAWQISHSLTLLRMQAATAREEVSTAQHLLIALDDAETGERGFLLTERDSYLAPYRQAVGDVTATLKALDALAQRSLWLSALLPQLRVAAETKMAELAHTLALLRTKGSAAARVQNNLDIGKATMDQARADIDAILARSDIQRARFTEAFDERLRLAIVIGPTAAAIAVLLLGIGVIVLLHGRARLQQTQRSLFVQSARLRSTVDHIRDGVAMFDAEGRLLLSNAVFAEASGLPACLLRPGTAFADFAEAAAGWSPPLLAQPCAAGAPLVGQIGIAGRVLEVWRSLLDDGGEILGVSDITRRVDAEAIARQAQKMEAIGQITGGVAHDFNNMLQVISANLELFGGRIDGDDWLRERLGAMLAAVRRGARLTRHLLAFARRQPLEPEVLDPSHLLRQMTDLLRTTLGEAIGLELIVAPDIWPLRADPQQLETALLNLVINARDAMPEGGRIVIEAGCAPLDEADAAANADVSPGHYVMLAVSDTGIGMTAEQLSHAFEPFYTTKAEGLGTGLGLSMVYGFARQSGGFLKLYSEPGHGTTARLYIPRADQAAPAPAPAPAPVGRAAGELVLVVEDDAAVRVVVQHTLADLGYRVIEATDGEAALALLREGARPDILFSDVVMPGPLGARAFAEQARAMLGERLAVVFTSGYTENSIVHNGRLDEGVHLLSKPWRAADLARKLREALDETRAVAPAAALRVLLVEDEPLVRMTTADMLADLGHDVLEAATGAEALALLSKADCGIGILVVDLGLPDMDGRALVERARALHPALRVVVATGRSPEEIGLDDCVWLGKPYNRAALERAMESGAG